MKTIKLLMFILVVELAGGLGAMFTTSEISGWYATLARPEFAPPNWIFAPVWTVLYALMGVSAYMIWNCGLNQKKVRVALFVFVFQLILNIAWSAIFFGLHSLSGAFVELTVLWIAIFATILLFRKICRPAAWLLVPYFLWVTFAGYLNYSIWMLNTAQNSIACTADAKQCPDGSYVGRSGPKCEFTACPGE